MSVAMKQILLLNPEQTTQEELATYRVRPAARAVVTDSEGKVALLRVGKHGYYKLPGGGIDEGEDIPTALARECMEEIGCRVEISSELGMIEEHRKMFGIKQISYCYLARAVGDKGTPDFTEHEIASGFSVIWVPKEEAKRLLDTCVPTNQEGRDYIVPRDKCLLEAALASINVA